ncbi:MAG: hypothetical protein ACPGQS_15405 [Bradymonadia bacterium]
MLISSYFFFGIASVVCGCIGVLLERRRLAKHFWERFENELERGGWSESTLRGFIVSMSVFTGVKRSRDVLQILELCERRRWKMALSSIEQLPSAVHSRLLTTLHLRLIIHLKEWSRLEPVLEAVLRAHGSTRLVFAALVESCQWERALSFYDARLRNQGSQRERNWLRWLSKELATLQEPRTPDRSMASVIASFAEVMESRLPDEALIDDVNSALDMGVRCLEEAAAFIDFRKKVRRCESEKQRVHLIRETRVRSDWWGLKLEICGQLDQQEEPATGWLVSEISRNAGSPRGYRCDACGWVSSFGYLCPSCHRIGVGSPTRDEPQMASLFGANQSIFEGLELVEALYWSTLLDQPDAMQVTRPDGDVVLEAT